MKRLITADQIDFGADASTAVVSDSFRFVLPVPAFAGGGEPLVGPDGAALAGPDGRAIEGRGIVFFDRDDNAWEAARGDGSAVILFSPIDEPTAAKLSHRIASLAANPGDLTLDQVKAVIAYAAGELGIRASGASTRAYVAGAMVPEAAAVARGYGLHRRRADQVCRAVYVPGAGAFVGPAASPQVFSGGAVILKHGDSVRLVQPASFEATYRFTDGQPARVAELARQVP